MDFAGLRELCGEDAVGLCWEKMEQALVPFRSCPKQALLIGHFFCLLAAALRKDHAEFVEDGKTLKEWKEFY